MSNRIAYQNITSAIDCSNTRPLKYDSTYSTFVSTYICEAIVKLVCMGHHVDETKLVHQKIQLIFLDDLGLTEQNNSWKMNF